MELSKLKMGQLEIYKTQIGMSEAVEQGGHCVLNGVLRGHFLGIKT